MTPNEARIEAVKKVVGELPDSFEVWSVTATTAYGFTLRIGGHNVRFSAQVEEAKHPRKVPV